MLGNVIKEIIEVPDWFLLGACLGLKPHTLATIREAHMADPESCKVVMIEKWLQGMDEVSVVGGPSWQQLADILEYIGHKLKAQKIKKDYC